MSYSALPAIAAMGELANDTTLTDAMLPVKRLSIGLESSYSQRLLRLKRGGQRKKCRAANDHMSDGYHGS